jgi:hypothetical protein
MLPNRRQRAEEDESLIPFVDFKTLVVNIGGQQVLIGRGYIESKTQARYFASFDNTVSGRVVGYDVDPLGDVYVGSDNIKDGSGAIIGCVY